MAAINSKFTIGQQGERKRQKEGEGGKKQPSSQKTAQIPTTKVVSRVQATRHNSVKVNSLRKQLKKHTKCTRQEKEKRQDQPETVCNKKRRFPALCPSSRTPRFRHITQCAVHILCVCVCVEHSSFGCRLLFLLLGQDHQTRIKRIRFVTVRNCHPDRHQKRCFGVNLINRPIRF